MSECLEHNSDDRLGFKDIVIYLDKSNGVTETDTHSESADITSSIQV